MLCKSTLLLLSLALTRCFVTDLQVRCHRHESVQECPERMRGPRTPQHPGLHLPAATAWEQQRAVQLHVATTSSRLQYHHHNPPRRVGSLMTDSVHHSRWQGQWPLLTLTQEHLEYETTFHVASSISKELARWRDSGTTRSDGWTTTTIVTGHFCQSHLEISHLWADRSSVLRLPKSKTNKPRVLFVFSVVGQTNTNYMSSKRCVRILGVCRMVVKDIQAGRQTHSYKFTHKMHVSRTHALTQPPHLPMQHNVHNSCRTRTQRTKKDNSLLTIKESSHSINVTENYLLTNHYTSIQTK